VADGAHQARRRTPPASRSAATVSWASGFSIMACTPASASQTDLLVVAVGTATTQ
jgi:hypothetical protein